MRSKKFFYRQYLVTIGVMTSGISSHNAELNKYFNDNEIEKIITKSIDFYIFSFWYFLYDFTNTHFYGYDLVKRYKLPYFLFGEKCSWKTMTRDIKIGKKIIDNIHLFFGVKARQYKQPVGYYKIF